MARLIDFTPDRNIVAEAVALLRGSNPVLTTVVFPAKRAGHAFLLEWARAAGGPAVVPEVTTMEELLRKAAGLPAEGEASEADGVYLLFKAAGKVFGDSLGRLTTDFASFYPWGAAWLRAMEELEKERVSPERIRELAGLDEVGERGRVLYSKFAELRKTFHSLTAEAGIYTPGMLFERAVQRVASGEGRFRERTVFVGLFALTAGERELIRAIEGVSEVTILRLHDGRKWSAFERMEKALAPAHKAAPAVFEADLSRVRFHSTPGAHAEILKAAEALRRWKEEGGDPSRTAVVLPDPGLLPPLLWEAVGNLKLPFNVTMGYPLRRTPLYALLEKVMTLSEGTNDEGPKTAEYLDVLLHPYVKNLRLSLPGGDSTSEQTRIAVHALEELLRKEGRSRVVPGDFENNGELLKNIRVRTGEGLDEAAASAALSRLYGLVTGLVSARSLREGAEALLELVRSIDEKSPAHRHPFFSHFLSTAVRTLEGLRTLRMSEERIEDPSLLAQLLRRGFEAVTIPFSGLPMKGLQVLGLLETRALSFDRVIVLDANEGVLPPVASADPVLPPSVRALLGLPSKAERVEVSRYHFTMLVSGCAEAHIVFVESPEKARSRFVEELLYLSGERAPDRRETPIEHFSFNFGPTVSKSEDLSLKAADPVVKLSPSDIDAYLKCPARYHLGSVAGIREPEDRLKQIDARSIGSIVHGVLRELYSGCLNRPLEDADYDAMIGTLPGLLEKSFPPSGQSELLKKLALRKLSALLRRERKSAGEITVTGVEVQMRRPITVAGREILLKGRADRIQQSAGATVVLDYKTGKPPGVVKTDDFEEIEKTRSAIAKRIPSFQLPLYVYMVDNADGEVNAAYVELKNPHEREKFLFRDRREGEEWMETVFVPVLNHIVGVISDPGTVFEADPLYEKDCNVCPYRDFCGR